MDDLKSKISAILSEAENSSSTPTQTKNIKIDNSTKNQGNFIFSFKNQGNHIYLQGSLIIAFLLIALLGFIFFSKTDSSKDFTTPISRKHELQYLCMAKIYAAHKQISLTQAHTEFKLQLNFYSYKKMNLYQFRQIQNILSKIPTIKREIKNCL